MAGDGKDSVAKVAGSGGLEGFMAVVLWQWWVGGGKRGCTDCGGSSLSQLGAQNWMVSMCVDFRVACFPLEWNYVFRL